jgi:hypothetical protein
MWGTFDEPDKFPPKGEFFCKYRENWMPEVPGKFVSLVQNGILTAGQISFTRKRSRSKSNVINWLLRFRYWRVEECPE